MLCLVTRKSLYPRKILVGVVNDRRHSYSYRPRPAPTETETDKNLFRSIGPGGLLFVAASAVATLSLPFYLSSNKYVRNEDDSEDDEESAKPNSDNLPPWVNGSRLAQVEFCTVSCHACTTEKGGVIEHDKGFDPDRSPYYRIEMTASATTGAKDATNASIALQREAGDGDPTMAILRNKIVVLPNLLTLEECKCLVVDTERILAENKAQNVRGCDKESWALYSKFSSKSQKIMERVLGTTVLKFLDRQMPNVSNQIFHRNVNDGLDVATPSSTQQTKMPPKLPVPKGKSMQFYWDDPVAIKYDAGNRYLAPHEDMRELTIVVPLNPLEGFPLVGGGTRFWMQQDAVTSTTTTTISEIDDGDDNGEIYVSLQPPAGTGILFNGDITHSGIGFQEGTRFVLMTSITLDEDEEYE